MRSSTSRNFTGNFLIDDTFLAGEGVTDFDQYRVDPTQRLQIDFFVPDDMPPPAGVSLAQAAISGWRLATGAYLGQIADRMTTLLLLSHPACLDHLTPMGHPERPDRLRAIERALEHEKFQSLAREQAPMAASRPSRSRIRWTMSRQMRDASPREGMVRLDGDTTMSPGTFEAALRAAGGAVQAVDEVMAGKAANAFVATRPPGHHAETATPMGFCLFNNVAIAARHAQKKHGAERVAIVDFDVHHGNGSQDIFWSDPTVMYCSTHQMPLYPGTGAMSERGAHEHHRQRAAAPGRRRRAVPRGDGDRDPAAARGFGPDLVIISAGFDAHMRDPLANLNFLEAGLHLGHAEADGTRGPPREGRVVSLLEGGYDLEGLAKSVAAHVTALMRG